MRTVYCMDFLPGQCRQSLQNLYQTVQLILFSRNAESRQRFLRRQRHLRISAILEVWNCSWDLGIIPAP